VKSGRLRTKALDGLRRKKPAVKSAISRTVLVNLIVNGGLVLQTSLRKNRLIVSYHQISWPLKKKE